MDCRADRGIGRVAGALRCAEALVSIVAFEACCQVTFCFQRSERISRPSSQSSPGASAGRSAPASRRSLSNQGFATLATPRQALTAGSRGWSSSPGYSASFRQCAVTIQPARRLLSLRTRVTMATAYDRKKFLKFLCQHLLAISWYQGPINAKGAFTQQPEFCAASAFLAQPINESDYTVLVTAGHVFTDYKFYTPQVNKAAKSHSLLDIWGSRSTCQERIPLNVFEESGSATYEPTKGRDFAFVHLPNWVHRLLSQTTTPFPRKVWATEPLESFDQFFMIGVPLGLVRQVRGLTGDGNFVTNYQKSALLVLERCDPP